MDKRPKATRGKGVEIVTAARDEAHEGSDVSTMVEGILDVLERHEADANQGVLSLLTAFMQAADRLLDVSTPEEMAHNREALLGMMDHAKKFVESWPHQTPAHWRVH
ncbi:MAG TPA: hypothetical protein PKK95_14225 [Vicinamibacterales bacterium]|nr:hypothetical protein [Vicinamibacterales bacterium]